MFNRKHALLVGKSLCILTQVSYKINNLEQIFELRKGVESRSQSLLQKLWKQENFRLPKANSFNP